jgi:hypothetical protein
LKIYACVETVEFQPALLPRQSLRDGVIIQHFDEGEVSK